MPKKALTIRAHHLVCLAQYAVFGGDHPTAALVLAAVREDPDGPVRVVAGPDDLCTPCPHWDGTRCSRLPGMEEKNRVKDARFLAVLDLGDGERSVREVYAIVAERVTIDVLKAVCADCEPDKCAEAAARFTCGPCEPGP
jgi:hypothetical protein